MRIQRISIAYLWPILLMCTIFVLSGRQKLATPDLSFQFSIDKVAHFLVFGLLATSIIRTPKLRACRFSQLILAIAIASCYGAFDELRQSLTPNRSVELADWFADTAGAIVAVICYARWHWYRDLLEWRPRKQIEK